MNLDRRSFLRAGGAALALPFLESLAPRARAASKSDSTPRRLVCVGLNFGIYPGRFFPTAAGRDYAMPEYLRPLQHLREDFTIFSKLDHPGVKGGHAGVHAFLSGVLSEHAKAHRDGNLTLDQKAAESVGSATRFPSLQLDIGGKSSIHSWTRLSWQRNGVAMPPLVQLDEIFNTLFVETAESERRRLARAHKANAGILDVVHEAAGDLKRRLNRGDLDKLDEYFTSVREVERRLMLSEEWIERAKPHVNFRLPEPRPIRFVEKVPLYYELIKLALQTDSTRVLTYAISDWDGPAGIDGVTQGYHTLTHHGRDPERLRQLGLVEDFLCQSFAGFLDSLKAVRAEEGATLLDRTAVLLGSGMGNASSHSNRDLPLLVAGGGFKHGEHKVYVPRPGAQTPACNLYLTLLQRFGLEIDRFGTSTGTLTGFA